MRYIIVIARLPGIYGNVNRPYPRATPLDSGRFTAINPWRRAITITYRIPSHIRAPYIGPRLDGVGGGGVADIQGISVTFRHERCDNKLCTISMAHLSKAFLHNAFQDLYLIYNNY